jgi:hypothetical protein
MSYLFYLIDVKENATPAGRRKPSAVVSVLVTFLARKGQHGALRLGKIERHPDELRRAKYSDSRLWK